jgi:hypothetical protein
MGDPSFDGPDRLLIHDGSIHFTFGHGEPSASPSLPTSHPPVNSKFKKWKNTVALPAMIKSTPWEENYLVCAWTGIPTACAKLLKRKVVCFCQTMLVSARHSETCSTASSIRAAGLEISITAFQSNKALVRQQKETARRLGEVNVIPDDICEYKVATVLHACIGRMHEFVLIGHVFQTPSSSAAVDYDFCGGDVHLRRVVDQLQRMPTKLHSTLNDGVSVQWYCGLAITFVLLPLRSGM